MKRIRILSVATRQQWRAWLKHHHRQPTGIWVKLYKQHHDGGLHYPAAVEEALCFGWIDGQLRRIDADSHMLRFSPRRPGSTWAPSNIARVRRLIKAKKMTAAGLQVFTPPQHPERVAPTAATPKSLALPSDLKRSLRSRAAAWQHWQTYAPSFRRIAIVWVKNAKHPTTRQRRIRNVVANAARYARGQY